MERERERAKRTSLFSCPSKVSFTMFCAINDEDVDDDADEEGEMEVESREEGIISN